MSSFYDENSPWPKGGLQGHKCAQSSTIVDKLQRVALSPHVRAPVQVFSLSGELHCGAIAIQLRFVRFKRASDVEKQIANPGFQAIRVNRANAMKTGFLLRIDSRESPRFAL